jgi:hypothetical protein
MRIKILQKPGVASIDGMRLDRFRVGQSYDVGHLIGSVFLAEGWAEPFEDDTALAPATVPANLIREFFPPYYDTPLAHAAESHRRRRRSK